MDASDQVLVEDVILAFVAIIGILILFLGFRFLLPFRFLRRPRRLLIQHSADRTAVASAVRIMDDHPGASPVPLSLGMVDPIRAGPARRYDAATCGRPAFADLVLPGFDDHLPRLRERCPRSALEYRDQ